MYSILKILLTTNRLPRCVAALLCLITLSISFVPASSHRAYADADTTSSDDAASTGNYDQLQKYCESKVKASIKSVCSQNNNPNNIKYSINAASHVCKDVQPPAQGDTSKPTADNDMATCILVHAKFYIDMASDANKASTFNKQLTSYWKSKNLDYKHLDDAAGQTPGTSTSCSPTNGLCADCDSGGDGCVNCGSAQYPTYCADPAADPDAKCDKDTCDFVLKYVNPTINLLSVTFGLIAAGSIIVGGIQYASSAGDPQKVTKAKGRIFTTVFAIIAYFFVYAFLQFLVPGGIFNRS